MVRNRKSIVRHQTGLSAQQLTAQAWAIKTNGVIMQWTRHKLELAIPMLSAEIFISFHF